MANGAEELGLHLRDGPADAGARGQGVAAAAELLANLADIHAGILLAEGDADFVLGGEFLDESGDDDAVDGADGIDEALVVLRLDA